MPSDRAQRRHQCVSYRQIRNPAASSPSPPSLQSGLQGRTSAFVPKPSSCRKPSSHSRSPDLLRGLPLQPLDRDQRRCLARTIRHRGAVCLSGLRQAPLRLRACQLPPIGIVDFLVQGQVLVRPRLTLGGRANLMQSFLPDRAMSSLHRVGRPPKSDTQRGKT